MSDVEWTTVVDHWWNSHRVRVQSSPDEGHAWRVMWTVDYVEPDVKVDEFVAVPGRARRWEHVEEYVYSFQAYARLATLAYVIEQNAWLIHPGNSPIHGDLNAFNHEVTMFLNRVSSWGSPLNHHAPHTVRRYPW